MPDRERVAGHLCRCEGCDEARRDLEAVFALLADTPDLPESLYGEANTRLALQTEFGPGPLHAERGQQRREDLQFGLCAALSALGAAGALAFAAYLRNTPGWAAQWMTWTDRGMAQLGQFGLYPPYWPGLGLLIVIGSLAGMLPALLLHHAAPPRRRIRREV